MTALTVDGQQQAGNFLYNAADQTTQMKVGAGANQLTEEYTFDPQTGLLTNQKVRNTGGTAVLDLSYGYQRLDQQLALLPGKTGHLTHVVNNLDRNKDRKYDYDTLGRLTKASGGAAALGQGTSNWTQNYTYDIFGNRTSVTASGQSAGNPIPTDGIANVTYSTFTNRITTAGFEYDANGNQTRALSPDGQTYYRYEYDDANRLVYIKQDNGTLVQTQEFGIGNNRISVTDAATNQKTYYQGNAVEYTESNNSGILTWVKSYVYLGDSLLSTTTPNGAGGETIEYSHPDALGTRLVSNAQTGTTSENVNLPFGTQIQNESTNTTNKRKFTSYDRSAVTGLDYAQNRTYDPKQGRFTQVDPIGIGASSLMNPQSLNLYAYCGNDPINHTDPTGLFWGKLFKGILKVLTNKWVRLAIAVAITVLTAGAAGPLIIANYVAGAVTLTISSAGWVASTLSAILFAGSVGAIANNLIQRKAKQDDSEGLLGNCLISAFLDAIAWAEGANYKTIVSGKVISSPNFPELVGQKIPFGNSSLPSYTNGHPNVTVRVRDKWKNPRNGKIGPLNSTAAGRYQITKGTWESLGGGSFDPHSQDLAAVKLLKGLGATDDLQNLDLDGAIDKANGPWASLPGSKNNQPTVSRDKFKTIYNVNFNSCWNTQTRQTSGQ